MWFVQSSLQQNLPIEPADISSPQWTQKESVSGGWSRLGTASWGLDTTTGRLSCLFVARGSLELYSWLQDLKMGKALGCRRDDPVSGPSSALHPFCDCGQYMAWAFSSIK